LVRRSVHFIALWLAVLGSACRKPVGPPQPLALPLNGVTLKLIVVDDSSIAAAVSSLRAEWKAVTGGNLEVIEQSSVDSLSAKSLAADAVIFPSSLLGTLVERGDLLPLSQSTLASEELAWSEVFELLQHDEARWGRKVYAIPLGSPVFTLMYRADLLSKLDRKPPQTWDEYRSLVEALGEQLNDQKIAATVEPLAPGWRGRLLLARAAGYAKHHDNYSTLFRIDTMEPLIAGPPYVRALEELVATAKQKAGASHALDPTAARREVLAGRAAMAITWASSADSGELTALPEGAEIAFAELPGSVDVFNITNRSWSKRAPDETNRVPLLSIAGRLAAVSQSTLYPEAAQRLIVWLSGPRWSVRVAADSPATTLYRHSQLSNATEWVDANLNAQAALQYGETVQRAFASDSSLSVPRIPASTEYLQALDEAVTAAIGGTATAEAALADAATKWKAIAERHGVEAQRHAYERSLGLEP
jgi:multiple sugar transport system substrate-binding protein